MHECVYKNTYIVIFYGPHGWPLCFLASGNRSLATCFPFTLNESSMFLSSYDNFFKMLAEIVKLSIFLTYGLSWKQKPWVHISRDVSFTSDTTTSCNIMALQRMTWGWNLYVVCIDKYYSDHTSDIHHPTQHFNVI